MGFNGKEKKKHILSKSAFIRGLQCPRSLYLNKYYPELRDETDPQLREIFQRGTDVGLLAQELFPGGTDTSPNEPGKYREAVLHTRKLISQSVKVLYEAAFQFNRVLCLVDILVNENGKWKAYEVKSSTRITGTYIMDTSLQYYVITGAGLPLEDISVVYINKLYTRGSELDIRSLFNIESVLRNVMANQAFVGDSIKRFKGLLKRDKIPCIDIGEHCWSPYGCDFTGYCWEHIPENSVFDIAYLSKHEKFKLYKEGIINLDEIPDDYPLNRLHRLQVDCYKNNRPFIDPDGIKSFLQTLNYPLYFLDFETFMPAVPLYDNSRPYQHIPFQYSLHYLKNRGAGLRHSEFLADAGMDPRKGFIERLLDDTRKPGDILVYSRAFEVTRLKELEARFPEYAAEINKRISRIRDLMVPFKKRYYYTPEMKGSCSLKAVLPALVTELSYDSLNIGDGMTAMKSFEHLQNETDKNRVKEIRSNLLEYCRLDTLAMVRILERLEDTV